MPEPYRLDQPLVALRHGSECILGQPIVFERFKPHALRRPAQEAKVCNAQIAYSTAAATWEALMAANPFITARLKLFAPNPMDDVDHIEAREVQRVEVPSHETG